MWWIILSLFWWCGTSAIPSPTTSSSDEWICPEINEQPIVECTCDMPHTLRCIGEQQAMQIIGTRLRSLKAISLLDCTITNITSLPAHLLTGVALHGLVISSGTLRDLHPGAFAELAAPLQALGLPNNQLTTVPTSALQPLTTLDRLDLSSNRIKVLNETAFKNLSHLTFLDISDNPIGKIASSCFNFVSELKILRVKNNRITIDVLTMLNGGLHKIEELDLSGNLLVGPLTPQTLAINMHKLNYLQLGHNSFSSIQAHALKNCPNLTSLSLHHNQIDVLEDDAFLFLKRLTTLDLAHNRIVAISSASLSHLTQLTELNLQHNFLRALTSDLILPSLKKLHLDDNDITLISSEAFSDNLTFSTLTLSDNPLNCDCSLVDFKQWLHNTALSSDDKASVVCTTPPSLENALLINISTSDLLCGSDSTLKMQRFSFDGATINLTWSVLNPPNSYSCDAIFIYEEEASNEVLLETRPLSCNSSMMLDASVLIISLPNSLHLERNRNYRYCIVLLDDTLSLILGCSDVLPFVENDYYNQPRVLGIEANLSHGKLDVNVSIFHSQRCDLTIGVLDENDGMLLAQQRVNCTRAGCSFVDLRGGGYRVCASIVNAEVKPRCVNVYRRGLTTLDIIFIAMFVALSLIIIMLIIGVRRMLLKVKMPTHQCFLSPEREDERQHSRYVKLQATTKL